MIILEGMDGSGKSTLANMLQDTFNILRIHPGAPPKDPQVEYHMMQAQNSDAGKSIIYDRVTCISQQVYRKRMFDEWYMSHHRKLNNNPDVLIIFCRPPDEILLDPTHHKPAPHDTPEMLQLVNDNLKLFVGSYDNLMLVTNHIVYNYTNQSSLPNVFKAVTNHLEKLNAKCRK